VHVRPRCQLLRQGVQLPRRLDLALTNRCARALSPRSTCTLVDFYADAICHHCLPGHLYSFTSLRISGQRIGDDVYIEDRYLRILRINNAAVDKFNRNSTSQGNQRISCYYRMTPTTATDRVAIEEDQSSFILSLQKTRLMHYPVLTPVPCTTLETPPSAQPTTMPLTSSPSSDQTTQISQTKFSLATATTPGAVSCIGWNTQSCRFLVLFRTQLIYHLSTIQNTDRV